jgi:hypothetical protein
MKREGNGSDDSAGRDRERAVDVGDKLAWTCAQVGVVVGRYH